MFLTVAGLVLAGLGVAIGWYGLVPLTVLPRLLRTGAVAPSEVTPGDSFVVCRGRATDDGQTVTSPFTGTRCLGFEYEVSERQPFAIGIPWLWAYVDDGVATVPFRLTDDSDLINVDPSRKRFSLDTASRTVSVRASETPPSRIQRFVEIRERLSPPSSWLTLLPGFGDRRYVERRVDPGTEYVVAGRPQRQQGTFTLAGNLVIADHGPTRIALNRLRGAVFPLVVASLFVSAGAWLLLL